LDELRKLMLPDDGLALSEIDWSDYYAKIRQTVKPGMTAMINERRLTPEDKRPSPYAGQLGIIESVANGLVEIRWPDGSVVSAGIIELSRVYDARKPPEIADLKRVGF
jgi:hypothetical protein